MSGVEFESARMLFPSDLGPCDVDAFYEKWGGFSAEFTPEFRRQALESVRREYIASIRSNRLRMRRELFVSWASFRHNWPMVLFELLCGVGGGFLFGVCLALAVFVYCLSQFPA